MNTNKQGFGFIEIILVLAAVLFLCYTLLNSYFKRPTISKETEKALTEQGIDTANYTAIKESIRQKLDDIQRQRDNNLNQIR